MGVFSGSGVTGSDFSCEEDVSGKGVCCRADSEVFTGCGIWSGIISEGRVNSEFVVESAAGILNISLLYKDSLFCG